MVPSSLASTFHKFEESVGDLARRFSTPIISKDVIIDRWKTVLIGRRASYWACKCGKNVDSIFHNCKLRLL